MCSEASFLSSGFSIYAKQILSRLYATNKYEIAEFASYANINDPRDREIPWTIYANAVQKDDPRFKEYSSRPDNMFGRWRFDRVVIDFKPDVVIDVRDYWMSYYQENSPCRKYFHWVLMPTVDSAPQQQSWINTYLSADAVFTYSDWGANILKEQSANKINYIDTASPGVDLNSFKMLDRAKCKQSLGVPQDSIIIGSVMRNQKRKLIPDLFQAFRKLLDKYEKNKNYLGKKIYLYLHTSYPDAGWDIPELLKEHRLANKVLFTYSCKKCGHTTANTFHGPLGICRKCMSNTKAFPSVTSGVSTDQLAVIYNIFDMYVQYSICEGFGMPQVEAGACGIPIATVNYSAMCDIVEKLKAYPIAVKREFKELETRAIRVYPDNDSLIEIIEKFISLPEPIQNKKRLQTRQLVEKHYNWDDIAKKWESYLDSIDKTYRSDWSKTQYLKPFDINKEETKDNLSTIVSLCKNNMGDINYIADSKTLGFLNDADYGFQLNGMNTSGFDITKAAEQINTHISNNNNLCDALNNNVEINEDYIQYARIKSKR